MFNASSFCRPSHCLLCVYYLATSTDVERLFSRGRLILSHTRSRLSMESTCALLCLGSWSLAGLVKDSDVEAVAVLDDVTAKIELEKLGDILSRTRRGKL
ncbi:uncharacterized protein LACBIDRAFT_313687 [Laccaria bicolor S238N-H82]|uniref:Predicted protein n=1 Tax=Laccaria bicolor (strain S238N-H82 / ATCC MYA-4686) TaxID=486041 RepID=B0D0K7_LACBS|nr:uncharacterized protein LACBIDRAFT_313687 [Laccaria bicolor S238N-H82]EDR11839.1 predicted protein [Laccaria bicolor S238N-H82]|eukprot:XP_001877736.1 predicted protein [Laccaria bicolor S238N-H82]